jgi:hypothetical protein
MMRPEFRPLGALRREGHEALHFDMEKELQGPIASKIASR